MLTTGCSSKDDSQPLDVGTTTGDAWERYTEFVTRIDPSNGDVLAWYEFSSEDINLSVAENGNVVLAILNEEGLHEEVPLNPLILMPQ